MKITIILKGKPTDGPSAASGVTEREKNAESERARTGADGSGPERGLLGRLWRRMRRALGGSDAPPPPKHPGYLDDLWP